MKVFPAVVLVSLVALCYRNSLWGDMVFDDLAAVRDNRDLRPHSPLVNLFRNDFWGTPLHKHLESGSNSAKYVARECRGIYEILNQRLKSSEFETEARELFGESIANAVIPQD
ncbi:transmembrane and TPR repeat-containing protein 3 [Trichonephila inaurata madagascariensis]|uniref:Transmembrane and TPR repeat-containing protein 3 n=1 Tax=Trichonephila inaurata madagascariensis TaxID=2747483 RepID=A0A8X7BPX6_9ARAC|nr:transmembrane and TPR repeat-containing protein 3 [Trichonephila inaurata madagascariensis]